MMLDDYRLKIIVAIVFFTIIVVFSMDPIAQDPSYHNFADHCIHGSFQCHRRRIYFVPDSLENFYPIAGVGYCFSWLLACFGTQWQWRFTRLRAGAIFTNTVDTPDFIVV